MVDDDDDSDEERKEQKRKKERNSWCIMALGLVLEKTNANDN